ncbi:uncharacterized protein LOC132562193 [Ylistrum balloti]|uniref:uncharacterized protein LOC132562193 n=1 Tax=Ylistrum balloti TaxID=509963 RepID=UPI002905D50A|nr:uncharacterized protein LOC132562193 [Ylistrum balloti]
MVNVYFSVVAGKQSCYSCMGVSRKEDCNTMRDCADNSVCYTRRTVSNAGNVTFDFGCKPVTTCNSLTSSGVIGRKKRSHERALCNECCDADAMGCTDQDTSSCGCNRKLCALPEHGNKYCYSCRAVNRPSDCFSVDVCNSYQSCSTVQMQSGPTAAILYTLGCTDKRITIKINTNRREALIMKKLQKRKK